RASSTRPVLSDTESRARRIFTGAAGEGADVMAGGFGGKADNYTGPGAAASGQAVVAQLLAQGRAVDAEHRRGAALVAVAVRQHFGEQRDLQFLQRDLVQVAVVATVEVAEVAADRRGDVVP